MLLQVKSQILATALNISATQKPARCIKLSVLPPPAHYIINPARTGYVKQSHAVLMLTVPPKLMVREPQESVLTECVKCASGLPPQERAPLLRPTVQIPPSSALLIDQRQLEMMLLKHLPLETTVARPLHALQTLIAKNGKHAMQPAQEAA